MSAYFGHIEKRKPPICENCFYYAQQSCKRHAPISVQTHVDPVWPHMKYNDWCGDFKKQEKNK